MEKKPSAKKTAVKKTTETSKKQVVKKKKGFTLIELLAVIVILAVIMLIGVTAVGPIMTKSKKSSLGDEGLALVDAAKTAFHYEQANGTKIRTNSSACFSYEFLIKNGYYDKSSNDYGGSVLIEFDSSNNTYSYKFWISNEEYQYSGVTVDEYNSSGMEKATDYNSSDKTKLNSCGQKTGVVNCTGVSCS